MNNYFCKTRNQFPERTSQKVFSLSLILCVAVLGVPAVLPAQGLITFAVFSQESRTLFRFKLQRGIKQMVNLLPAIRCHHASRGLTLASSRWSQARVVRAMPDI